eukprot:657395-Amorphochlora_amoeboformis.AAC.2
MKSYWNDKNNWRLTTISGPCQSSEKEVSDFTHLVVPRRNTHSVHPSTLCREIRDLRHARIEARVAHAVRKDEREGGDLLGTKYPRDRRKRIMEASYDGRQR